MFNKKTVLVVGAGASLEAGMPVGTTLAEKIAATASAIARNSKTSSPRLDELRYAIYQNTAESERQRMAQAANKIANGIHLAGSIDAFIDRHVDDPYVALLGKALIASEILDAESQSSLMAKDGTLATVALMSTWYHAFAALLTTGYKVSQLDDFAQSVSIVCFNYDRCIEQYLVHAISQGFALPYDQAYKVMRKVKIIHPYGDIGRLPSNPRGSHNGEVVAFGERLEWTYLDPFEFSSGIRTFTEQEHDGERQAQIYGALKDAARIIFLGFSFQPQNMALMALPDHMRKEAIVKDVLATGFGIDGREVEAIQTSILKMYRTNGEEEFARPFVRVDVGARCAELFARNRLVFLYD